MATEERDAEYKNDRHFACPQEPSTVQGLERRELPRKRSALNEPTPASPFVLILPPPPDQEAIAPLAAANCEAVCLPHSNFTLE